MKIENAFLFSPFSCVFYLWKGSKRDERGKESGGSFVFICSFFPRLEWQVWKMDGLSINLDFDWKLLRPPHQSLPMWSHIVLLFWLIIDPNYPLVPWGQHLLSQAKSKPKQPDITKARKKNSQTQIQTQTLPIGNAFSRNNEKLNSILHFSSLKSGCTKCEKFYHQNTVDCPRIFFIKMRLQICP